MSKSAKSARGRSAGEAIRPMREKNYKIWITTYHGNGLKTIRDEFITRVRDGLRRNFFIIDLDGDTNMKIAQGSKSGGSVLNIKNKKSFTKSSKEFRKLDLLATALNSITGFQQEYDYITEVIAREKKFDLLEYWKKDMPTEVGDASIKDSRSGKLTPIPESTRPSKGDKTAKGGLRTAKAVADKTAKSARMTAKGAPVEEEKQTMPEFPMLQPKLHNKVGMPAPLSKRKYIEDWPENSKLYFIFLIKDQESAKKLVNELLSRSEPVQAIIHFLPQESNFDRMMPINRTKEFLRETWEELQKDIYQLRQISLLKPVGMLHQQLPVISDCMAAKLTHQIFNELSWFLYDLEILQQHYQNFYFDPYNATNVAMDASVNVGELQQFAESLSIQGHFLQTPMPASVEDIATVAMYLESLLSTVEKPENLLSELDMLLLSSPAHRSIGGPYAARAKELLELYKESFGCITKLKRFNRIMVDQNNRLLCYLLGYTNVSYFQHIYFACLEYHNLRTYSINSNFLECIRENEPYFLEPFYFPPYCRYFPSTDGVWQRKVKLMEKYPDYQVDILSPNMKLYRFKRRYNEVIEDQKMSILPSRLCYRDFTLFQKEEFLENLVTPEMRAIIMEAEMLLNFPGYGVKKIELDYQIDEQLFIRQKSLKARKLAEKLAATDHASLKSSASKTSKGNRKSNKKSTTSNVPLFDEKHYVGLPPRHPLLEGYNLEDTRQEITVKTLSYYYKEGMLQLYEDRHCFTELNKTLKMVVKQCRIQLNCVRKNLQQISNTIQVQSRCKIGVRILNKQQEQPKVVLNYPNGLVVYFNEADCEQIWLPQETFNEERRRITIPEGAVIVFNKREDLIRIMRYNGEIYELYQYELAEGEEEEVDDLGDLGPSKDAKEDAISKSSKTSKANTEILGKKKTKEKKTTKSRRGDKKSSSEQDEIRFEDVDIKLSKANVEYLEEVVENEFRFLNKIMEKYCISFVHLKITTTLGRIIHVKHSGKIYEKSPISLVEWHDYWANESYAMRDDGVKLIWTKDELKCYFPDKTLIRTKAIDAVLHDADVFEDNDNLISASSSHIPKFLTSQISIGLEKIEEIYETLREEKSIISRSREELIDAISNLEKRQKDLKLLKNKKEETADDGAELTEDDDYTQYLLKYMEEEEKDTEYVVFQCENIWTHQEHYVTVHFMLMSTKVCVEDIQMGIFAADNIHVQIVPDNIIERETEDDYPYYSSYSKTIYLRQPDEEGEEEEDAKIHRQKQSILKHPSTIETNSSARKIEDDVEAAEEKVIKKKSLIKICFGEDVKLKVGEDECRIEANMERYDPVCGKVLDYLKLKFKFDEDLVQLFPKFTSRIAEFINYNKPAFKLKTFLEVERTSDDCCSLQGFEFRKKPPPAAQYRFEAGNAITILSPLQNVMDRMVVPLESYLPDMRKFPRFRKRDHRRSVAESFPRVASCVVYIKVPKQLSHSDEIHKFVEPFDLKPFKRMRRQMKETIIFHTKPQIRLEMQKLTSRKSWEKRQIFHRCRLLSEMQRKGLYHAMLKHSSFPNFQKFRGICDYQVQHIDFFDFMSEKCNEEALRKKKEREQFAKEREGFKSKFHIQTL